MATDEEGRKVWQRNLDTRGNPLQKTDNFVPFLYQSQYFDEETGLAYNRFRYRAVLNNFSFKFISTVY